jgi:hypothetical protein
VLSGQGRDELHAWLPYKPNWLGKRSTGTFALISVIMGVIGTLVGVIVMLQRNAIGIPLGLIALVSGAQLLALHRREKKRNKLAASGVDAYDKLRIEAARMPFRFRD